MKWLKQHWRSITRVVAVVLICAGRFCGYWLLRYGCGFATRPEIATVLLLTLAALMDKLHSPNAEELQQSKGMNHDRAKRCVPA